MSQRMSQRSATANTHYYEPGSDEEDGEGVVAAAAATPAAMGKARRHAKDMSVPDAIHKVLLERGDWMTKEQLQESVAQLKGGADPKTVGDTAVRMAKKDEIIRQGEGKGARFKHGFKAPAAVPDGEHEDSGLTLTNGTGGSANGTGGSANGTSAAVAIDLDPHDRDHSGSAPSTPSEGDRAVARPPGGHAAPPSWVLDLQDLVGDRYVLLIGDSIADDIGKLCLAMYGIAYKCGRWVREPSGPPRHPLLLAQRVDFRCGAFLLQVRR